MTPAARRTVSAGTHWELAAATAAICLGFWVRLSSMTNSLWLDELSTLWAVEASLSDVLSRVPQVMGQTPFYFAWVWLSVNMLGESEWALRLPSLLAVMGAAWALGAAANQAYGARAGWCTALIFWLCYPAVWASVDARPYSFAFLFAALATWGWVGACLEGGAWNRGRWVAGTAGLVWSHYVFLPFAVALPLSSAMLPSLRLRYPWKQLARDAAVAGLLVAPALLQFATIVKDRAEHRWGFDTGQLGVFAILVPFALAMVMPIQDKRADPTRRAVRVALWGAAGIQLLALEASRLAGLDLLVSRYAYVAIAPAAFLAGTTLARLRGADVTAPLAWFAMTTALAFAATWQIAGSASGAGYQEWRQAVSALRNGATTASSAPLLFRSGNAEDDLAPPGEIRWPATLAPLRSPGEPAPSWEVLPLTYRWEHPGREAYFENRLRQRLSREPVFFLLCLVSEEPGAEGYCPLVESWVERTWPGGVSGTRLGSFRQLVVTRFERIIPPE